MACKDGPKREGVSIPLMDRSLVCRECGVSFVFTQGEQEFFQSRGLTNPPSRCPKCRAVRRAQQAGVATIDGALSAPRPTVESRPMFPATCARCGQQTQVPFQPRGDRPVYCTACFHAERAAAPGRPLVAARTIAPRVSAASVMSIAPNLAEPVPDEDARRERRARSKDRWDRTERDRPPYRRSRQGDWGDADGDEE
jgi:CxxC-x17-CxxC domain-containing protein